jgi:uncharacterized RDD family membrane protein YckC
MSADRAYRGAQLGLPETGPGSIASLGARLGAFVVDAVASALVAAAFVAIFSHGSGADAQLPRTWSLVPFAADYVIGLLVAGRTLGMYLFGLRVVRVDREQAVTPGQALSRTVLLMLLVPALIMDRDARGLHDRLTSTAVVRG